MPRDPSSGLSLDALAGRRHEAAARGAARLGRCRGRALAGWARTCRRHFGERGLRRLRDAGGPLIADLPEEPPKDAWFPVGVQLTLTDALLDTLLDGDPRGLEDLLRSELERALGRVQRVLLRGLGPAAILRRAGVIHRQTYDFGEARAEVRRAGATVMMSGPATVQDPTWQLLQLVGLRLMVTLTGRALVDARAHELPDGGVELRVAWR